MSDVGVQEQRKPKRIWVIEYTLLPHGSSGLYGRGPEGVAFEEKRWADTQAAILNEQTANCSYKAVPYVRQGGRMRDMQEQYLTEHGIPAVIVKALRQYREDHCFDDSEFGVGIDAFLSGNQALIAMVEQSANGKLLAERDELLATVSQLRAALTEISQCYGGKEMPSIRALARAALASASEGAGKITATVTKHKWICGPNSCCTCGWACGKTDATEAECKTAQTLHAAEMRTSPVQPASEVADEPFNISVLDTASASEDKPRKNKRTRAKAAKPQTSKERKDERGTDIERTIRESASPRYDRRGEAGAARKLGSRRTGVR